MMDSRMPGQVCVRERHAPDGGKGHPVAVDDEDGTAHFDNPMPLRDGLEPRPPAARMVR